MKIREHLVVVGAYTSHSAGSWQLPSLPHETQGIWISASHIFCSVSTLMSLKRATDDTAEIWTRIPFSVSVKPGIRKRKGNGPQVTKASLQLTWKLNCSNSESDGQGECKLLAT